MTIDSILCFSLEMWFTFGSLRIYKLERGKITGEDEGLLGRE